MNKENIDKVGNFEEAFEYISNFIESTSSLEKELVEAKNDFFRITGKLNESDLSFSNRMNAFLLWFSFDWQCSETLKTPFELFIERISNNKHLVDYEVFIDMKDHVHSLFETTKLNDRIAIIKDLYTKKKYEIQQPDFLLGSSKGLIFETRIFKFGKQYRFSNYFIQHPAEVKKDTKKQCKQLLKKGESIKPFLMLLHSYHTKWERYRNISMKSIYHFDKKIPEAK